MDTNSSAERSTEDATALSDAHLKTLTTALAKTKSEFISVVSTRAARSSREETDDLWAKIAVALMQTDCGNILAHLDQFYTVLIDAPSIGRARHIGKLFPSFLDRIDGELKKILARGEGSAEFQVTANCMGGAIRERKRTRPEEGSQLDTGAANKATTNPGLGASVSNDGRRKRPAPASDSFDGHLQPTPPWFTQRDDGLPWHGIRLPPPPRPTGSPAPTTASEPAPPTPQPSVPVAHSLLPSTQLPPPTERLLSSAAQPSSWLLTGPGRLPAPPALPLPSTVQPASRTGHPPPASASRPTPPVNSNPLPLPPPVSRTPSKQAPRFPPPPPLPPLTNKSATATSTKTLKRQGGVADSFKGMEGQGAQSGAQERGERSVIEASPVRSILDMREEERDEYFADVFAAFG